MQHSDAGPGRKRASNVLVAIGANLPGADGAAPLETCRRAAAALDGIEGLRLIALSRWYDTTPQPPQPGAPRFVNGVALLAGPVPDPARLLAALHALEDAAGRARPYPNAPRTLDLDLIAIDGLLRDAAAPILPHPRAHLRRFVLEPLRDVAPGWVHPRLGQDITALLAALPEEDRPVPIGE
ncbi:2-amino-4-hydroxy-6-hydroxymethyldihydropteridine diphosphokinase [Belnapia sp. T6]|uniref:2-amino-4-hydroxy-6-hydroxymethyldihydropteridine pyrophosphokinase n=1 Tax=Belnapia mucosa TaxID=2804532 RepID=A0ABS1UYC3_9PROT|nr:2-amino-4-hydroxy-6-hydroxymethyldihydropteridine diphosphokinase [Belnapia mucosa]MBL6454473.1 2-amino-4-hydroxy-6-hydroxymethyldihydropteridine diphosphokinase [Belnapia mucosa]